MLKGIYSAASGMTGQMLMLDGMADAMANVSTPGYKEASQHFKAFSQSLVNRIGQGQDTQLGSFARGTEVMNSVTNFKQGDLMQTGNPLDVAIQGDGFFKVKTADGQVAYTRAGNFERNSSGILTTLDGAHVQSSQDQDIQIPQTAGKIVITGSGDVNVDGQVVARLDVTQFDDNQQLDKLGSSLYTTTQTGKPAPDAVVQQGFLEGSNANAITEMVNSIAGMRTYEALQKTISIQNETLGQAINSVGRLS